MTIYTTSVTPRARVRVEAACRAERPRAASVVVAGSPLASIKKYDFRRRAFAFAILSY